MENNLLKGYDLEYCKQFSEEKLRKIYNGENPEVLEALILAVKGSKKAHKDIIEAPILDKKKSN